MRISHRKTCQSKAQKTARIVSSVLLSSALLSGCMDIDSTAGTALVANSAPERVAMQILINSCNDPKVADTESTTTGDVKGLSKVKDGFGIPYDEHADNYVNPPVPITDDSYEANKERGIGYAGLEAHLPECLKPGETHDDNDVGLGDTEPGTPFPGMLTAEEEKYGCCVRWEYSALGASGGIDGYYDFLVGKSTGHMQYVAIHSLSTDKWCICCPYDYGPAHNLPTTGGGKYAGGRLGGVTPAVAKILGFEGDGSCPDAALTEWWWVENSDQVKCGEVNDLSEFEGGKGSSSSSTSSSSSSSSASSGSGATTGTSSDSSKNNVATNIVTSNTAKVLTFATGGSSSKGSSSEPISPKITQVNDDRYNYWLYEARPGKANQPLIVSLHGSGEGDGGAGNQLESLRTSSLSRFILEGSLQPDCNVLMPQAHNSPAGSGGWNDPQQLKSLIDDVVSKTKSDKKRISITGVSMGGFGTWNMLSAYPDFFSAGVPIASSSTDGSTTPDGLSQCKAKVRSLIGEADGYNASGMVDIIKGGGGTAEQISVPGAGHSDMCNIYGNEEYNPVPFLLGQSNANGGQSSGSSRSSSGGKTVKIEPANPNSFVDGKDPKFKHGLMLKKDVKYIMMHDTQSGTYQYPDGGAMIVEAWKNATGPGHDGVAAHFIVQTDGKIYECVPLNQIAHHAGYGDIGHNKKFGVEDDSRDDKVGITHPGDAEHPTDPNTGKALVDYGMNSYSIGIEIEHDPEQGDYPEEQLNSLDRLVAYIDKELDKEAKIIDHKMWRTSNTDCSDNFPLENYQKSRNHNGVMTEEDAEEAKCSSDEADDSEDDGESALGNGNIAATAVEIACTASPEGKLEYSTNEQPCPDPKADKYNKAYDDVYKPGTPCEHAEYDNYVFGDGWIGVRGATCCRGVGTAVKASGADPMFPADSPQGMADYMRGKPELWTLVGHWRTGDSSDVLKPGDVLVCTEHIKMWVGEKAVKAKYPNSDGNLYEAAHCAYMPWIHNESVAMGSGDYEIFRCKGQESTSSGSSSGSTKSDSNKKSKKKKNSSGSSDIRNQIVDMARSFIGVPYVWGGKSPDGFDCSGLTTYCYEQCGLNVGGNRTTYDLIEWIQAQNNWTTDVSQLQPGDMVFPSTGHAAIYAGDNMIIHAPQEGSSVCEIPLYAFYGGGWAAEGDPPAYNGSGGKKSSSKKKGATYSTTDFSDTFIVGDSVLALSSGEGGFGDMIAKNIPGVKYDVESGRYFESDVGGDQNDGMIDIIKREAGKYKRYVIECGINDAGLTPDMANQFVSALKKDGVQIYFVNQRVIGGADDTTCKTIKDTVKDSDGIFEIDWNGTATGHESEWLSDGCHPNQTGAEKLTTLIHDELVKHAEDGGGEEEEEEEEEEEDEGIPIYVDVTQA